VRQVRRLQIRLFEFDNGFAIGIEERNQHALRREPLVDGAIELNLGLLQRHPAPTRIVFATLQLQQLGIAFARATHGEQQIEANVELVKWSGCHALRCGVPGQNLVWMACVRHRADGLCGLISDHWTLAQDAATQQRHQGSPNNQPFQSDITPHADLVPLADGEFQ
jgi:hypothetical protein